MSEVRVKTVRWTRANRVTDQTRMSRGWSGISTATLLGTCQRMCSLVGVDAVQIPSYATKKGVKSV